MSEQDFRDYIEWYIHEYGIASLLKLIVEIDESSKSE